MKQKYRYQFPLVWELFKWGITIGLRHPIIHVRPPKLTDPEDSMLIYIGMFDEDEN